MPETPVLIVGASFAGLAVAACLRKKGVAFTIVEKENSVGAPWHRHYDRLHLHTPKNSSHLPFKPFAADVPVFPSRLEVLNYLQDYQQQFAIQPLFNTEIRKAVFESGAWATTTNVGSFRSAHLVVATGMFAAPNAFHVPGIETFSGPVIHSAAFTSGRVFHGKKVLVAGFGNSACEIAIDLFEQGASPAMSVRSAVNIIPRELAGIPILNISRFLSKLPPPFADAIVDRVIRLRFGNFARLGLRKLPYGPFTQIHQHHQTPVIDIGIVKQIRHGHIRVMPEMTNISGNEVHFTNGQHEHFEAIVAATGYKTSCPEFLPAGYATAMRSPRLDDSNHLFFCGFRLSPTGLINQIAKEAQAIANAIAQRL